MIRIQREIERANPAHVDPISAPVLKRPVYQTDSTLARGCVQIDNLTIRDHFSNQDFKHLIVALLDSRRLLFSEDLNREDEKRRRLLVSVISSLNWQIKDVFLQARLIKPMLERIRSLDLSDLT